MQKLHVILSSSGGQNVFFNLTATTPKYISVDHIHSETRKPPKEDCDETLAVTDLVCKVTGQMS